MTRRVHYAHARGLDGLSCGTLDGLGLVRVSDDDGDDPDVHLGTVINNPATGVPMATTNAVALNPDGSNADPTIATGSLGDPTMNPDGSNADPTIGQALADPSNTPDDFTPIGAPYRFIDATKYAQQWAVYNNNLFDGNGGTKAPAIYPDLLGAQDDFVSAVSWSDPQVNNANPAAFGAADINEIVPDNQTLGWNVDFNFGSAQYKQFAFTLGRSLGLDDLTTTRAMGALFAAHWYDSIFTTKKAPFELGNSALGAEIAAKLATVAGHPGAPSVVAFGTAIDTAYAHQRAILGHDHGIFGDGFGAFLAIIATAGLGAALAAGGAAADTADATATAVSSATDAGDYAALDTIDATPAAVAPVDVAPVDVTAPAPLDGTVPDAPLDTLPTYPTPDATAPVDPAAAPDVPSTNPVDLPSNPINVQSIVDDPATTPPLDQPTTTPPLDQPTAAQIGVQSGDPYYSTPLDAATPAPTGFDPYSAASTAGKVVGGASTVASVLAKIFGAASGGTTQPTASPSSVVRPPTPSPYVVSSAAGSVFGSDGSAIASDLDADATTVLDDLEAHPTGALLAVGAIVLGLLVGTHDPRRATANHSRKAAP